MSFWMPILIPLIGAAAMLVRVEVVAKANRDWLRNVSAQQRTLISEVAELRGQVRGLHDAN